MEKGMTFFLMNTSKSWSLEKMGLISNFISFRKFWKYRKKLSSQKLSSKSAFPLRHSNIQMLENDSLQELFSAESPGAIDTKNKIINSGIGRSLANKNSIVLDWCMRKCFIVTGSIIISPYMSNFIFDNDIRLLLENEQKGMLAVISFICLTRYVHTLKIIKSDFHVMDIYSHCPSLVASN